MLDLNSVTLTSLLNTTVQDSAETDTLPVLTADDHMSDDDKVLDPGAFVLLFSQLISNTPEPEKTEPVKTEWSPVVETTKEAPLSPPIMNAEEQVLSSVEDNVAVAWINSDYYQSELNPIQHTELETNEMSKAQEFNIKSTALEIQQDLQVQPAFVLNKQENKPASEPLDVFQHLEQTKLFINKAEHMEQGDPYVGIEFNELPILKESVEHSLPMQPQNIPKTIMKNNDSALNEAQLTSVKNTDNNVMNSQINLDSKIQTFTPIEYAERPEPLIDNHPVSNQISANIPQFIGQESAIQNTVETSESLTIPVEITHPEWSKQFSEQIVWLGQQGIKGAVIKVHPEDLGPLEININVVNDVASVNIASHSQDVRNIIEQSLPQLQKMMEEQGLSLAEVNIDSDTGARQSEQERNQDSEQMANFEDEVTPSTLASTKHKKAPQGVIDYFA